MEYTGTIRFPYEDGLFYSVFQDDAYLFLFNQAQQEEDRVRQLYYVKKEELETGEPEYHLLLEGLSCDNVWETTK